MTQLDCTVTSCLYNKDSCCSRGDIVIGGRNASSVGETSCQSFCEKSGAKTLNSASCPMPTVKIDCEAKNCRYNSSSKCQAGHIGISGGQACSCKETECTSFTCK